MEQLHQSRKSNTDNDRQQYRSDDHTRDLATRKQKNEIRGFLVITHNYKVKPKKDGKREGRDIRGVAIILSPWFKRAYERADRQPPIYLDKSNPEFIGRFEGITVAYPNHDSYGKIIRGDARMCIASVYHHHEEKLYDEFNADIQKENYCCDWT
jgi:hypothetical protein